MSNRDEKGSLIACKKDGEINVQFSTSKYAKLAKCSEDTALWDIKISIERSILIQDEGGGRSTGYRQVSS